MTTRPTQALRLAPIFLFLITSIGCLQKPNPNSFRRKVLEESGQEAWPIRRAAPQKGTARYFQNIEFKASVKDGFICVVSDFHDRIFHPTKVNRLNQLSYDQAWYLYKVRTKRLDHVNDGDHWLLLAADDSGYTLFISEPVQ